MATDKDFSVTIPHSLGQSQAQAKIARGVEMLQSQYAQKISSVEARWNANVLDARLVALGQTVTGTLAVHESNVVVTLQLPFLLRLMGPKIQALAQRHAGRLLK